MREERKNLVNCKVHPTGIGHSREKVAVWFVVFFFSCQAAVRLSEEDASLKDDLVQPECAHRPPRRVHGCLAKAPPGLGGTPSF